MRKRRHGKGRVIELQGEHKKQAAKVLEQNSYRVGCDDEFAESTMVGHDHHSHRLRTKRSNRAQA